MTQVQVDKATLLEAVKNTDNQNYLGRINVDKSTLQQVVKNTDNQTYPSQLHVDKATLQLVVRKRAANEFWIENNTLKVFAPTAGAKSVTIGVTDANSATYQEAFAITVT